MSVEARLASLEKKFDRAAVAAAVLGVSVVGLGTWVNNETARIKDLDKQVKDLDPFVKDAKIQLTRAGQEQIMLIQQKAVPIVSDLTNQALGKMSANGTATNEGTTATNMFGKRDYGATEMKCPAGQYVAGITVHWGGTCNGQCDADGGPVHALVPICQKLVP